MPWGMDLEHSHLHHIHIRHPQLSDIMDFDLLAPLLAALDDWAAIHAIRVFLNQKGESMSLWVYAADLHRKPK